ncbi:MAG: hypothetical protein QNJ19_00775 [Woeseiaceae bacterium]|nr:hypothetical protein [Woeseiaceae bacterium]
MHELIEQVISELRGAWRFRWLALGIAWVTCLVGWAVVFMMPNKYESEAIFYVGKSRLDSLVPVGGGEDSSLVDRVRQSMLLTPSLEKVARNTDLDLRATTREEKQALIDSLALAINIDSVNTRSRRNKDGSIFRISYRDTDPQMSLKVVDEVLDTFREEIGAGRTGGSEDALEFLESGIADYRAQLQQRERELADFRRENVGLLPGEGRGYFETLQDALAQNREIQGELSLLLNQRDTLQQQLRGQEPILSDPGGSGGVIPKTELEQRISVFESTIQELLTRFTEKHPDVIAARDQLAQLRAQREKQLEELSAAGGSGNVASNNPVYQQLQISLNSVNLEIAELQGRLATSRTQVADLQAKIDVIPQIEAQLAELTRDYDQINSVYNDMRAKYEQEKLRRKRLGWDNVTFETMEPPNVGRNPVSPMRSQLILLVTLAGLGVGGAIAYLLQQLKPVFIDGNSLRRITGLPVLGSVSMAWESQHRSKRRRELLVFASATGMIFVAVVLLLVFREVGVEVGSEVRKLASL